MKHNLSSHKTTLLAHLKKCSFFQCHLCTSAFNQKSSLEIHIRKHTGVKPYVCDVCKMGFTQLGNLRSHVARVHTCSAEDESFKCEHCPCVFKKVGTLNAHVSKYHIAPSTKPETNPSGEKLDSNKDETGLIVLADKEANGQIRKYLVTVRVNEDGQKTHLCNYCQKGYRKPSDLCKHLRMHCLEKPFRCKHCPRSFSVKSAMLAHLRIHRTKDFPCDICDKKFQTNQSLKAHLRLHAVQSNKPASRPTEKKLVEPYVLTTHGLVQALPRFKSVYNPSGKELQERPYRCTSCTASFKKSSHLKVHQSRHNGERNFKCDICNRAFVTRSTLNAHIKTHGQDQAFQCSDCSLTFTTLGSVKRHMAAHREIRPYFCPYCKRSFKTAVLCKKHMKVHAKTLDEDAVDINELQASILSTNNQVYSQDLYTADSTGTITLQDQKAAEFIANIGADGTITLQQAPFEVPSLPASSLLTTNVSHAQSNQPKPIIKQVVCTDCKQKFANEQELLDHRSTCKTPLPTLPPIKDNYTVTFDEE